MKKTKSIIWGVIFIAVGCIFALNALGISDIDVFFDGWWTLFIIVPCAVGFFTQTDKFGNLLGFLIGVFLLLCCQDILEFEIIWKLTLPAIIILIGIKMVFGNIFTAKKEETPKTDGKDLKTGCAVFSGTDMNFDNEVFDGAELTAVFGDVKCDLRNAVIESDAVINMSAIFGGITVLLPENINVKVNSNSLFGGITCKKINNSDTAAATIFINGTCMFGGADIK